MQPSEKLRKLEVAANEAFDVYRDMCVPRICACISGLLTHITGTTKAV